MKDKNERPEELLEYLADNIGCMYLSDLHQPYFIKRINKFLIRINPMIYSLYEWDDAVFYITGENRKFENQTEAADFLKNFNNDNIE